MPNLSRALKTPHCPKASLGPWPLLNGRSSDREVWGEGRAWMEGNRNERGQIKGEGCVIGQPWEASQGQQRKAGLEKSSEESEKRNGDVHLLVCVSV